MSVWRMVNLAVVGAALGAVAVASIEGVDAQPYVLICAVLSFLTAASMLVPGRLMRVKPKTMHAAEARIRTEAVLEHRLDNEDPERARAWAQHLRFRKELPSPCGFPATASPLRNLPWALVSLIVAQCSCVWAIIHNRAPDWVALVLIAMGTAVIVATLRGMQDLVRIREVGFGATLLRVRAWANGELTWMQGGTPLPPEHRRGYSVAQNEARALIEDSWR